VLNASLVGIIREARNRFGRVVGIHGGFEGLRTGRVTDISILDDDQLDRLARTPSAGLSMSRLRPNEDEMLQILQHLQDLDVSSLIGIGGNDTADTLDRLAERAEQQGQSLQVIGLPKTIDNDLAGTDHSLGFPSAARFLAAYVRDALVDARATASQYQVKLVEVMGRNAGWLAASSALWIPDAMPAPVIALPERPFASERGLLDLISSRVDADGFVVVVVPETMRWANGEHVAGSTPEWVDAFGHPYHASAGQALLKAAGQHLGLRGRVDRPGSVTRASMDLASEIDLSEAVECGRFAVKALIERSSRVCVVIDRVATEPYESTLRLVSLATIANVEHKIPDRMLEPLGQGVSAAFFDYAAPLVGSSTQSYEFIDWPNSG